MMLLKCCTQHATNLETHQWPQDWKRSVFIPIPKKGSAKDCSNYQTIAFISHASKVRVKILQARLQQYMNRELPDVHDEKQKVMSQMKGQNKTPEKQLNGDRQPSRKRIQNSDSENDPGSWEKNGGKD